MASKVDSLKDEMDEALNKVEICKVDAPFIKIKSNPQGFIFPALVSSLSWNNGPIHIVAVLVLNAGWGELKDAKSLHYSVPPTQLALRANMELRWMSGE